MIKDFLTQYAPKIHGMKEVYQYIQKNGLMTKVELIKKTKMKQTTVARHLDELMNKGLIRIKQYDASSGGRPPALYAIEPEAGFIIGIDLSRVKTNVAIVNLSYELIANETFKMTENNTPEHTINLIKVIIHALLKKHGIRQEKLLGIGIGTVGPLDRKKGVMINPKAFIAQGWNQVCIVAELEKEFQTKVLLENGANTAALYEATRNFASNKSILYCISGWGVRCGVVTEGKIMQNRRGKASSFGEMIIDIQREKTLSSLISYGYLLQEAEKKIIAGGQAPYSTLEDYQKKNEKMDYFKETLLKGDPVIQDIVLQSGYYYGLGIANIVNILHPEVVVLSSELMKLYPAYYEKVVKTAKTWISENQHLEFSMEKTTTNPMTIGACVLTFESYF